MIETKISSTKKEVIIGYGRPTVLIGERINPTGKKKLAESLRAGNMEYVQQEALDQVRAGADILDVNVGVLGLDQTVMLPRVVQTIMETVDVPLCVDSDNPAAIEAALKIYNGKALVNSVSGEKKSLANVLPLVKAHGAAVVGLIQDDEGTPKTLERRIAIAHRIIEKAEALGVPRQDVVIDCLAFAIGANSKAGVEVIDTIHRIKEELGVNVTMGASNVSFGMPDRDLLTNGFVAAVVAAGATSLIVDVAKVRPIVLAVDLVLGHDPYAKRYIKAYRERLKK